MSSNVLWNVAEVSVAAISLFITFKVILENLGIAALGVWSLLGAVIAMARFADAGVASALPAFISRDGNGAASTMVVVNTAILVNCIVYAVISCIILAFAPIYIATVELVEFHYDSALLFWCVGSLFVGSILNTLSLALIGIGLSGLKSRIMVFGSIGQLLFALILIPRIGLAGLAASQLVQFSFSSLLCWLALIHKLEAGSTQGKDGVFDQGVARALVVYGVRLQALNMAGFMFEPMTRFAISHTGGLAALGLYELTSRVVSQARQLIVMPSSNFLAIFAATSAMSKRRYHYRQGLVVVTAAGAVLFGGIALASPLIGWIWLGRFDMEFSLTSSALCIGWFANVTALPAYYLGISSQRIKWNIAGAAVLSVAAPLAVALLVPFVGPAAIGPSVATALVIGAMITHFNYGLVSRSIVVSPVRLRAEARRFLRDSVVRMVSIGKTIRSGEHV